MLRIFGYSDGTFTGNNKYIRSSQTSNQLYIYIYQVSRTMIHRLFILYCIMKRLPNEILFDIFNRLDFRDKLQCILTCHDWYNTISSFILYSKISLKHPQEKAKGHLKRLYDQGLGYQIMDLYMPELNDPVELSRICPNLKSLYLNDWNIDSWDNENNLVITQNWKNIERIVEIHYGTEGYSPYYLAAELLRGPYPMMSLTSVSIDFYQSKEGALADFIRLMKNAPMLEFLQLSETNDICCTILDELHSNAPNLKELILFHPSFTEDYYFEVGNKNAFLNSSTASNMRSFSISIDHASNYEGLLSIELEIKRVRWIEYMCRKYTNLIEINVHETDIVERVYNINIMTSHLRKAFRRWIHLKKFDMEPVYLSADILQAMDDYLCLDDLKVYIHNETYMEQLTNLAHSKQGMTIRKLTLIDRTKTWTNHWHLVYYLESLSKNGGQLKELNLDLSVSKASNTDAVSVMLSPNQILHYVPLLQKLYLDGWNSTAELVRTTHKQINQLRHLHIGLAFLNESKWKNNTQQHVQQLIYNSPILQSFALDFFEIYGITLDFQQNIKLKHIECSLSIGSVIKIIQNKQMKCYSYCMLEGTPTKILVKVSERLDNECRIILHLRPSIRSLFIYNVEYYL
jgi:hypothetical protein